MSTHESVGENEDAELIDGRECVTDPDRIRQMYLRLDYHRCSQGDRPDTLAMFDGGGEDALKLQEASNPEATTYKSDHWVNTEDWA